VAGLFMGTLADRYNRTRIIGIGVVVWSVFTAASGMAKNFIQLAIPRLFIGVGESAMTPTALSILSDRYEQKKSATAVGIYYMGVPVGVGVSLIIAGYLGPAIGWRGCFYLLGFIGVFLGLMMLLVRDTPRKKVPVKTESKSFIQTMRLLFGALTKSKSLIFTIIAGTLYHMALGSASAFEQVWAVEEKGLDKAMFAQASGWIFAIFGVLGAIFGGTMSDWTLKKFNLPRTWFLLLITLLFTPLAFTRYYDPESILFWIGICASAFSLGCFYGPVFAVIQELVSSNLRATIVAFNLLCVNLLGFVPGSLISGILMDNMLESVNSHPFAVAMHAQGTVLVYSNVLVGFAIMFLIMGTILYYLAGKYYESDRKKLSEIYG
tara:strand:- start:3184 stop:4317 length:1134 start_codon:yes stop_codon:yes gene_type:complete